MNTTNTIIGTSSSTIHMYTIIHTSQCSTRRHQEGNLSLDTAVKSGIERHGVVFPKIKYRHNSKRGRGLYRSLLWPKISWVKAMPNLILSHLLSLHSDYFSIYLGYDTTFNITYLGLLLLYWYSRVWTEEYLCICVWYSYMQANMHVIRMSKLHKMLATTTAVLYDECGTVGGVVS